MSRVLIVQGPRGGDVLVHPSYPDTWHPKNVGVDENTKLLAFCIQKDQLSINASGGQWCSQNVPILHEAGLLQMRQKTLKRNR